MQQRERFPKADPQLIERQIYAFELVGLLAKSGKPFVFKGGTSLLLLLPTTRRLSIDVDIIGDFGLDELSACSAGSVFNRVEEDKREESEIPKKHFKFFYRSNIDERESYVLLDVLCSDHGYPKLLRVPIQSPIFQLDEHFTVDVPTINCILGDKLTAYAPNTIGVPFRRGKSMEIVKQLFDIGVLFDACDDLLEVGSSYRAILKQQSRYLKNAPSAEDVLNDTVETSFLLCQSQLRGGKESDEIHELHQGIKQVRNILLGTPYRIEEARLSAAKAALIATAIRKRKETTDLNEIRYADSRIREVAMVTLDGKYSILNKLRAVQTEAFYYWWIISRM